MTSFEYYLRWFLDHAALYVTALFLAFLIGYLVCFVEVVDQQNLNSELVQRNQQLEERNTLLMDHKQKLQGHVMSLLEKGIMPGPPLPEMLKEE